MQQYSGVFSWSTNIQNQSQAPRSQRHLPDSSDGCLECGDHIFHEEVTTVASLFSHGFPCTCICKAGQKKKKRREHLTAQYTKGYNKCNLIRKHFLWLPLSLVNFWNDFLNSAGIVVRHYSRHLLSDSSILKTLRTFLPFK